MTLPPTTPLPKTHASDSPSSSKKGGEHDDLRFVVELALRGVGYRHRRRQKPYVRSEDEAHIMAGRVVDALRAKYSLARKPSEASWPGPPRVD